MVDNYGCRDIYIRDLPNYMKGGGVKIHSLISKGTEISSLIENALLNLLIVPLNYLNTPYPTAYNDV